MKWHDYQYKLMIFGQKRRRSIKICHYQYIPSQKYRLGTPCIITDLFHFKIINIITYLLLRIKGNHDLSLRPNYVIFFFAKSVCYNCTIHCSNYLLNITFHLEAIVDNATIYLKISYSVFLCAILGWSNLSKSSQFLRPLESRMLTN